MTITNDRIKIIEKIAALLAKADSTTFAAEADTARSLAAKLMANYEIKNSELKKDDKLVVVVVNTDNNRRRNMKHAVCYNIISGYCGVYMVTSGTSYKLIGKQEDIDATIYMMNVIWTQVEEMTERWYSLKKKIGYTAKHKNSYQHGLINGIQYNLDKINQGVFKYKQESGLVPVNQNKADKQKAENWFTSENRVKSCACQIRGGQAFESGRKDSENINMRNRVSGNSNLRLAW